MTTDIDSDSPGRKPAGSTGKLAVLGMVGLAVLAATFAWWWNYNRGRKALEFYGAEATTLIRSAPKVEIIGPDDAGTIEISHAPGLLNARASLLSDASYRWSTKTEAPSADSPGVRFSNGDKSVVIRFDFPSHGLHTSSTDRVVRLTPKTANGWQSYLERQVKAASK